MATVPDVYAALKDAIDSGVLNVYDYEEPAPAYPALILGLPTSYDTHPVQGNAFDITIPARLLIEWDDPETAFDLLLRLISTTGVDSIQAAIEADETLGGVVDDATVTGWEQFGFLTTQGEASIKLLTGSTAIEVMA